MGSFHAQRYAAVRTQFFLWCLPTDSSLSKSSERQSFVHYPLREQLVIRAIIPDLVSKQWTLVVHPWYGLVYSLGAEVSNGVVAHPVARSPKRSQGFPSGRPDWLAFDFLTYTVGTWTVHLDILLYNDVPRCIIYLLASPQQSSPFSLSLSRMSGYHWWFSVFLSHRWASFFFVWILLGWSFSIFIGYLS